MDTILDRPFGLRLIGLLHVSFGLLGLLAFFGLLWAIFSGAASPGANGPIYAIAIFFGAVIPCLVIGNYVDDLRRNAVVAQIIYSIIVISLTGYFIYARGLGEVWTYPWGTYTFVVNIGNLAALILAAEVFTILYIGVRWKKVVPPPGVEIIRDKKLARQIEEGLIPSPLAPTLVGPDGTPLPDEETERILEVRRVTTEEGMAILCSNCGGATPLTKAEKDNTLVCDYCGVRLGIGSVFIPCKNHPEYLAATTCDVCGEHFCRRCLTAQEPPVDPRWSGSTVYVCQTCFEGRYRPAVTTASLVIPIDHLFDQAGGRFSRVASIYKKFLGKYASVMKHVLSFAGRVASGMLRSSRGRGSDNVIIFLIMVVVAVVAIPIVIGILMLLGALVIIPALFYAGLVGITIEAIKIIRRTDFVSLDEVRLKGIKSRKPVKKKESILRDTQRDWEQPTTRKKLSQPTHWRQ